MQSTKNIHFCGREIMLFLDMTHPMHESLCTSAVGEFYEALLDIKSKRQLT